jgi:hypothetical protein
LKTGLSGKLGRALAYLAGQWPTLQTFSQHGDVPLSNNHAESAPHAHRRDAHDELIGYAKAA